MGTIGFLLIINNFIVRKIKFPHRRTLFSLVCDYLRNDMIELTRITETDCREYGFTEKLLTATFPHDEYRDLAEQRANVTGKQEFHLMLARYNGEPVGFISYWKLREFFYVEHLATLPDIRGKGHGKAILERLQEIATKIVLEVEEPVDEITTRRVGFYRRAGFEMCRQPYLQPPYRAGDGPLPMRLMFYGCPADEAHYARAKENIYNHIYNYKE